MNRKITTIAALGVAAIFIIGILPTGSSQEEAEFGTQVQRGDADFIPSLDRVWTFADGNICFLDFGETNVQEFGFYLRPDAVASASGNLERFAVRLTEGQGNAAGTLVLNSHTAEQNRACTSTGVMTLKYGDVNNNGRYDSGDYVWFTTDNGATGGLDASSAGDTVTIRMTQTNGGAAGTLVFAQDGDYTSYDGNANDDIDANSMFGFHNVDRSGGTLGASTMTTGDQVYLAIAESGTGSIDAVANGDLLPMHSLRLHGDAGAFGSQVAVGDEDFIPLVNEISLAGAAFDLVCVVRYGDGNNVGEFGFYLNPHATVTGASVEAGFIRLNAFGGNEAGTRVRGTDTTEDNRDCDDEQSYVLRYADLNSNGRYDDGDWVFLTTAASLPQSTSGTQWTLRLTETNSGSAGTLVFAGDNDFQAWSGNTSPFPGGGDYTDNWGIFDLDRSGIRGSDEIFTQGDSVYLIRGNANDSSLVPVYSIRIAGDAGDFGTQVGFGDEDFIPTLEAAPATATVCVVALGDGQNIGDFGFYLVFAASPGTVPTNAVRLKTVEGNPAGSTVRDADTTERGQTCAEEHEVGGTNADSVLVMWTDRNNNGRYDSGDDVYLTKSDGTQLVGSTSATRYTLRLSEADGEAPGTLVFSGDSDLQSHGNEAQNFTAAAVSFFDRDLSGAFNREDAVYVHANALSGHNLVQLYSIRVTGELPTGGGGGPGTSPSPTDGTESPDPTNGTESPDPTDGTGSPDPTDGTGSPDPTDGTESPDPTDDDEDEGTPGFGLVAILAAFGLVAIALRRRS